MPVKLLSTLPRLTGFCSVLAAAGLSSCQHGRMPKLPKLPKLPAVQAVEAPMLYEWNGDHLSGPVNVKIVLSEQKAHITRGGEEAGWTYVAAGTPGHPTPPGSFRIIEKVADKHSNSWGVVKDADGIIVETDAKRGRTPVPPGGQFIGAPMPFWMRISGPIGMHAGHIPNPGDPASHGCIRLPQDMAEKLFSITRLGTPVQVVP
ncbi:MAG: L,D-transpeptidase [Verrucomicrobiota bacterium]